MMQFHQQLFRHDPENGIFGDCFRTVIASILGKAPHEVPHVYDGTDDANGMNRMQEYLRSQGCILIYVAFQGSLSFEQIMECGRAYSSGLHWLLTGKSRNGTNHVVICHEDRIVHDPSIDQSGIVGPTGEDLWILEWIVRPVHPEARK